MKKFSVLFVLIALIATTGITKAQSSSALSGKTFILVMKDASGHGDEIKDQMSFNNGQVTSSYLALYGYPSATVSENARSNGAGFSFTATGAAGTLVYEGVLEEEYLSGSIQVTDKSGQQTTMYFRGATEAAWKTMTGETQVAE